MKGCLVVVLSAALISGCGGFIGGDQPNSTSASGDDTADETTGASSSGADSTTGVGASGGEDTTGSATSDQPPPSTSGDSDTTTSSTTDDGLESSSSTTAADGFPYEGDYTGSFQGTCQIDVVGTLAIAVDAVGVVMGSAGIGGKSANVTGTVDALGTVAGSVTIPSIGQCNLTGSFNEDGLLGMGNFNCPSVACSGTWTLVKSL